VHSAPFGAPFVFATWRCGCGSLAESWGSLCPVGAFDADAFPAPTVQQVPQPFEFGLGLGALGDSFAEVCRLAPGDVHLRED
jgi:hypothetical protein